MGNITELSQGSLNGLLRQTNECLESAYNKGYVDGKKEQFIENSQGRREGFDNGFNKGYDRGYKVGFTEGLGNAWEMVRAIFDMNLEEKEKLYGYQYTREIVGNLGVHKAFKIYKSYEQAKQEVQEKAEEEIKVGDEVKDLATDNIGVVMAIGNFIVYITNNGVYTNRLGSLEKTGRHFDEVSQLLDKLKRDK